MCRETESNLQTWDSDPNASGSRTWPKEETEQSNDLRVDGISNDEIYRDEQYMQRIAEQVQKTTHLVTTFSMRRHRRKLMKQATARYMKFSNELTKYSVNVVIHSLKLDFKCVNAEEN